MPVRNAPAARAWSPAPSPGRAMPSSLQRPLTISIRSRKGASDCSVSVTSRTPLSFAGVQFGMNMPFGT